MADGDLTDDLIARAFPEPASTSPGRGSRLAPGMMMGLDRGGACAGVLFRIAAPDAGSKLAGVWQREMIGRAYRPVWVTVETPQGRRRALCFVADRASERYAGELPLTDPAHFIAVACGSMGANAVYPP